MELLREHVWRTVMESKQSQFWNAVSVAALTVVTAILYVYSAFLLSLWLLKRNKIRMGGTTARRSRQRHVNAKKVEAVENGPDRGRQLSQQLSRALVSRV